MTWIETIAVVFGLICVWLTIRQNILCWPAGLVQVVLFIVIFYRVKLYSDVILHVIYVVMQLYGWYHWSRGSNHQQSLPVSTLTSDGRWSWPFVAVVGTFVWGYLMATFTDAAVPYADSFVAVTSLIAQWLLARKKLESWYFWMVVDVVAIGIYFHKDLMLTAGLYAVFLVLAVIGLFAWLKSFRTEQELAGGEA